MCTKLELIPCPSKCSSTEYELNQGAIEEFSERGAYLYEGNQAWIINICTSSSSLFGWTAKVKVGYFGKGQKRR